GSRVGDPLPLFVSFLWPLLEGERRLLRPPLRRVTTGAVARLRTRLRRTAMKRLLPLALLMLLPPTPRPEEKAEVIHLFNGKDLSNFYTYLGAPAKDEKPYGKNNDPKGVFTVKDGVLRISGEVYGALTTEKEYSNYRVTVEFKWGEQTWGGRKDR